ncbi:hypothetical protein AGR7A_pAt20020 [Agrobacterium deltaense NCPPB 1641]|uniref:Uncharacterized protein n=1 Tax=Agrobacterium deltaense NCPPB 1641 TaxID=1183425 RepID=A0A1S7U7V5_9HYPH|nr:hypothetical protein AGR7A_pAt20020 [Agrobacterium deltaense NCPPB 1641]
MDPATGSTREPVGKVLNALQIVATPQVVKPWPEEKTSFGLQQSPKRLLHLNNIRPKSEATWAEASLPVGFHAELSRLPGNDCSLYNRDNVDGVMPLRTIPTALVKHSQGLR